MDNTSHPNEKQLEAMLKLTAQRMGTTPQALKEAAQRGDLSQLVGRSGSQQAAALQKVLSDPQAMGQIQGLLRSLNSGSGASEAAAPEPPTAAPAPSGPDLSALLGALAGSKPAGDPSTTALAGLTPQTLSLVSRLGPLLSQAGQEDDATRLLRALRPLLSHARQKKVDEAIRILQMLRLLPLLKESGAFSGLLSGLL